MILFYSQNTHFRLSAKRSVKHWIKEVIKTCERKVGRINFIFSNDDDILEINNKFLNHDFYTDVITFDTTDYDLIPTQGASAHCQINTINGDIYISVDTVYANSLQYASSFSEELYRVMIHGILHLIGYNDITDKDKSTMRRLENFSLSMLSRLFEIYPEQSFHPLDK